MKSDGKWDYREGDDTHQRATGQIQTLGHCSEDTASAYLAHARPTKHPGRSDYSVLVGWRQKDMNRVTLSYHRAIFKQRGPQTTYCILMKTKSYACDDHVFLTLISRLSNCFTRYRPSANITEYFNHCLAAEFKDSGIGLL